MKKLGYDVSGKWDPRWFGQYFGETFDRGDDIMGSDADRTDFDYLQWYNSSGGINFFPGAGVYEDPVAYSRYQRQATSPSVGGQGFQIWTNPA